MSILWNCTLQQISTALAKKIDLSVLEINRLFLCYTTLIFWHIYTLVKPLIFFFFCIYIVVKTNSFYESFLITKDLH